MTEAAPLLEVRRLSVRYGERRSPWHRPQFTQAVSEVDFNVQAGETLGIVGESGCGKSSLARALAGLQPVSAGAIHYRGRDIARLSEREWRPLRREIQLVFQDPLASLDPRMRVAAIVDEPLAALRPDLSKAQRAQRAAAVLERVGLAPALASRYPHELSGGQCQRVGIARALAVEPRLLILDEPVSSLDVSVQAQILNLLSELRRELQLTMLFIAHDLAVVRHISTRVLVMYLGRVMEHADAETLFAQPGHPYTRALLAAVPGAGGGPLLQGELPDPRQPPSGCVFRTRCALADAACAREAPRTRRTMHGAHVACHFAPTAELPSPPRALERKSSLTFT